MPALWKVIKKGREQHNMMGCSAFGEATEHEITMDDVPCGILSGHAYSIIDAFDLDIKVEEEDDDGKTQVREETVHLMRLRNPWGKLLFTMQVIL